MSDPITERLKTLQAATENPSGKWNLLQGNREAIDASMTIIPTMSFRWLVPSFAAYAIQPNCRRLQQLHHTSRGDKWVDIPMVEDQLPAPSREDIDHERE